MRCGVISSLPTELTPPQSNNFKFFILTKPQLFYSPYGHYNSYQEELYKLCTTLHKEGLGYRKISHFLNLNDYKTPYGKEFKNNHVFSIIKKGKVREERIKNLKSHKDYGYEFETFLSQ